MAVPGHEGEEGEKQGGLPSLPEGWHSADNSGALTAYRYIDNLGVGIPHMPECRNFG